MQLILRYARSAGQRARSLIPSALRRRLEKCPCASSPPHSKEHICPATIRASVVRRISAAATALSDAFLAIGTIEACRAFWPAVASIDGTRVAAIGGRIALALAAAATERQRGRATREICAYAAVAGVSVATHVATCAAVPSVGGLVG
jgi:hypothetical protein